MNVSTVNYWVKVSMFVQDKVSLEIKLEILENQLNIAVVWEEPEVDILVCVYLPMLDCWEFDIDQRLIERS